MNRFDFINMVNDPKGVGSQNIGEIREVIDLYPYFQTAHLLLLKGLHNTSDLKFAGQLASSSVHIANREVLYNLLNTISESSSTEEKEISNIETASDNFSDLAGTGRSRDALISEIEKRLKEIAAENVINFENHAYQQNKNSDIQDAELLNFEYEGDIEEGSILEISQQQENQTLQQKGSNYSELKTSQTELIDKFILANPRIEPVRDKAESPIFEISNEAPHDKEPFVTETLAKIYINQEYYSRAIDIYETLSLKFPEKSSYFATQIEKIKELIKPK